MALLIPHSLLAEGFKFRPLAGKKEGSGSGLHLRHSGRHWIRGTVTLATFPQSALYYLIVDTKLGPVLALGRVAVAARSTRRPCRSRPRPRSRRAVGRAILSLARGILLLRGCW